MLRLKLTFGMMAGVIAVTFGVACAAILMSSSARSNSIDAVDVAPRAFVYRMAGDFNQAGRSVDAPLVTTTRTSALHIMRRQLAEARPLMFCATCGVTFMARNSLTKSSAS